MKFKVGDRVRVKNTENVRDYNIDAIGKTFLINPCNVERFEKWLVGGNYRSAISDRNNTYGINYLPDDLELIINEQSSTNNMNMKEKFTLMFISEPEKSFRQAGITNGDDFLTEDGVKIFLGWLLKKHGTEFKTDVVDELLKEDK